MITAKKVIMLDQVAATTTSAIVGISQSQNISLQCVGASVTSGNGVFVIQISNDNVNWATYNRLTSNSTNTNGQTDTRVASVTVSSNASSFAFVPRSDTFQFMRAVCTVTTDGKYSLIAYLN
jgi:hypothetical protein